MPCFNESNRIGAVIHSIAKVLPESDIVVIDDGSSDDSVSRALKAGATVVPLPCNLGYGAALETGYIHATRHGYDVVVQMDADGQHLAEELPTILAPVLEDNADLVIGSRYLDNPNPEATSPIRRLGHVVFATILRFTSGLRLTDPTSGFQAMNRNAFSFFASGVFPCDYPDSDVILMAKMSGLRIVEVPTAMKNRTGGKSMHSGLKPLYYGVKMLLSIFVVMLNTGQWHRRQGRNQCTCNQDNS